MGTDRGQLLMIGQVGALENGWYRGPVGSGRDGWGDGIRSHRGKEVDADPTLEREESENLVAQGLNYAKIGPFLSTDRSFFENLCSGVANTCPHRSCKLQSEEHFIVWLHWFVPSARSKKGLKHGHVSHSHISRVRQQLHRVTYIWYNNNNRVHARVTQHKCSSLNWIDNTSAGGVDNFTPSVSMVFSSEWTEGGGRCLWIWSQASSSNPGPDGRHLHLLHGEPVTDFWHPGSKPAPVRLLVGVISFIVGGDRGKEVILGGDKKHQSS